MGSIMCVWSVAANKVTCRVRIQVIVVVFTLLAVGVLSGCFRYDDELMGTVLNSYDPAPAFDLQDQFGRTVSLADQRNKVVVLTFLYTYCPDICPIVASHIKETYRVLGGDVDQVVFVVISIDPVRDTVERVLAYSEQWDMVDRWSFLVGSEDELAALWKAYYIDPVSELLDSDTEDDDTHLRNDGEGSVDALREQLYTISHSAPVYLIDRDGLLRVLFTPPLDSDIIAHDVRLLID